MCQSPSTTEFRQLVERSSSVIAEAKGDLRTIYGVLGLDARSGLKLADASRYTTAEIQRQLPQNLRPVWQWVNKLQQGLIVEHIVESQPLEPYLSVATALRGAVHAVRQSSEHAEHVDWPRIVQLSRHAAEMHPEIHSARGRNLPDFHGRAVAYAQASLRLRERGYQCQINNGVAEFPVNERRRIVAAIEEDIAALGGSTVAKTVFGLLKNRWDPSMQRYLLGQRVNALGTGVRPEFPFGFVLQLAVKHLLSTSTAGYNHERWGHLVDLATDFAANYDVQPYSAWELETINAATLSESVIELALCDRLFGPCQFRPIDVADTLRGIFDWVPRELEDKVGWKVASAIQVSKALFGKLPTGEVPQAFADEALHAHCPDVAANEFQRLVTCLTHADAPNRNLVLPESANEVTFQERPLVRDNDHQLILLHPSTCAPACFAALAGAVYKVHKNVFSDIGLAVERFLVRRMSERGMEVLRGEYDHSEGTGECDGVIETQSHIIFAELKIKSLTRAAQGGSDLAILVDLAASLFDSAAQSNKHELVLRKRGALALRQADGSERVLKLNGRQVEKISLTFDDFGSFQDRTVLFQVFQSCLAATFEAIDTELQPRLANLNEKAQLLARQFEELGTMDARLARQPFFPFWFLSVPQVLVTLDEATSNESFRTQLWLTRHVATHSLDYYVDLASARQRAQLR